MGIESYINELEFSVVNIQFLIQFFLTVLLISFILLSIGYYLYIEKMHLALFMIAYAFAIMINQFAFSMLQIKISEIDQELWLNIIYISKTTSVLILMITSLVIIKYKVLELSLMSFVLYIISTALLLYVDSPRVVVAGYTGVSLVYLQSIILYCFYRKNISSSFWSKSIILYCLYFVISELVYIKYETSFIVDWIAIFLVIFSLVVYFLRRYKLILQEKIDLYDKLIYDELTGIYSKVYFNDLLENKYSGYLMMIDINKFKSVNDTFGHIIGDDLLVSLGRILQYNQTNGITVSRVGGDEFLVYTPMIDKKQISGLSRKIIEDFKNVIMTNDFKNIVGLGLSIGIIEVNDSSKLVLLEKVDNSMYISKSKGNNKITFYK